MMTRRRRLMVLAMVSGLISTLFVTGPTVAVAADPASLTVTATYKQGSSYKAQDVTMKGNSPGAPGCPPTSNCNQLQASLLPAGTACPATWTYENSPNPVVPIGQQNVVAGAFSKAFSISGASHPQLSDPSKYHLCSYLVDATTAAYATLASADTPLGTASVGSASLTIASQGPLNEATSGTISVDVSGTTSLDAQIAVQALDDGKQCGAWYPDNYEQQYASAFETVPAGNFALQLEVTPAPPDATGWETRPGYYKLCAYLTQRATQGSAYYEETPAATASLDHVITSVPCPSSTFSIDDPEQQVEFWIEGNGTGAHGAYGLATTHVTVPGPGTVSVTPEDGTDHSGADPRHYSKAGRFGVDIWANIFIFDGPDVFRDLYESQRSETFGYVATFTPDFEGASCVQSDETTFVLKEDFKGTRDTSIHWVPAETRTKVCRDFGCPSEVSAGCYTVEVTCYERTMTLEITRKRWSGTIKETGGGSHCSGSGEKFSWVYLWQFKQGNWVRFKEAKARNGAFSGKFYAGDMKKGGTFQATIGGGDYEDDYTCGDVLSDLKKVPPG